GVGPSNGYGLTYDIAIKYAASQDSRIAHFSTFGDANTSTTQVNQLQTVIAQKPDAIVIIPADAAALAAPIGRAMDAGIPVLVCGNDVATSNCVAELNIDD